MDSERDLIRAFSRSRESGVEKNSKGENMSPPERFLNEIRNGSLDPSGDLDDAYLSSDPGFRFYLFADTNGKALLRSENAPEQIEFLAVPESGVSEDIQTIGENRVIRKSFWFGLQSAIGTNITTEVEESQRFAWSLAICGAAVWIVGLAGGWWLAGRAIRPVELISRAANEIADGNLSERISVSKREDELHELSRVLNQTFDKIQDSMERERQFTADASHELRTPVSILLSETQRMCKRTRTVPEYAESMEVCNDAAERMRTLVEDLLLLARQENAQLRAEGEVVNLSEVVEGSVRDILPLATERNIKISTDCELVHVRGSVSSLAILANNLLSNAVLHHPGNGHVQVRVIESGEEVILRVTDDGNGISPEDRPHIFKRFYRVEKSRTASAKHSGIGLALVHSIVTNLRGNIWVASQLGEGSTFTIVLPIVRKTER